MNNQTRNPLCGYMEEEVIDYIMGRMVSGQMKGFQTHIEDCDFCQQLYMHWSELLGDESYGIHGVHESQGSNGDHENHGSYVDHEQSELGIPVSSSLKLRLRREVKKRKIRRFMKLKYINGLACAAVIVVIIVSMVQMGKGTVYPEMAANHELKQMELNEQIALIDQSELSVQNELIKQNELLEQIGVSLNPQSIQYAVQTSRDYPDIQGFIWHNGDSNEVLVMLNGLDSLSEQDVQAWFIKEGYLSTIGVLKVNNRIGYLYYQGEEMQDIETLAFSLEPKGGSHAPTGPDAMFVQFKR